MLRYFRVALQLSQGVISNLKLSGRVHTICSFFKKIIIYLTYNLKKFLEFPKHVTVIIVTLTELLCDFQRCLFTLRSCKN